MTIPFVNHDEGSQCQYVSNQTNTSSKQAKSIVPWLENYTLSMCKDAEELQKLKVDVSLDEAPEELNPENNGICILNRLNKLFRSNLVINSSSLVNTLLRPLEVSFGVHVVGVFSHVVFVIITSIFPLLNVFKVDDFVVL